jgi:lysophospholipase L1-like esterase
VAEELTGSHPEVEVVVGIAWHTRNGVAVLESDILPRRPELVFVFLGANDCAHRRDADGQQLTPPMEYENNMRAMVATIGSVGAHVALITVAPVNERYTLNDPEAYRTAADVEACNRVLRRLAGEGRARLVDVHRPLWEADIAEVICSDGLHATLAGHRIIAHEVLRVIEGELFGAPEVQRN